MHRTKRKDPKAIYAGDIPFNQQGHLQSYATSVNVTYIAAQDVEPDDAWMKRNITPDHVDKWTKTPLKEPRYLFSNDWYAALKDGRLRNVTVGPGWKPNVVFEAKMKVTGMGRGRSSAVVFTELVDGDGTFPVGTKFVMFLSEATAMMMEGVVDKGIVEGRWTFMKTGMNYSLRWYPK